MPPHKEVIWWHGVDISHVQPKSTDPVPPPPRRVPGWGCVSQFFLSAGEQAGIEQKGLRLLVEQAQETPSAATRATSRGSPARPLTAGAASPSKRGAHHRERTSPFAAASSKNDIRWKRPTSAPALLRNSASAPTPGLALKKAEDRSTSTRPSDHRRRVEPQKASEQLAVLTSCRQRVEDIAVRRDMAWMKREGHCKRDIIADVDVLADSSLFDLKVMHNGAQRARSEAAAHRLGKLMELSSPSKRKPKVAGRNGVDGKKGPKKASDALRDLCGCMQKDTKEHCRRLKIPPKAVEDGKVTQLINKLHEIHNCQMAVIAGKKQKTAKEVASEWANQTVDLEKSAKLFDSHFMSEMKGLYSATTQHIVPGDWGHPLVRLAYFLNGNHSGRLRMTLEAFDCACTGSLSQQDFCNGLEWLAYPSYDHKSLFALLDVDGIGELQISRVEDRLMKLIAEE